MSASIPLSDTHTARKNWYILFSYMLSPDNEKIRDDIAGFKYNNWLHKKKKRYSTELSPRYADIYDMFFSFINFDGGLKSEISSKSCDAIVSGLSLIWLNSLYIYCKDKTASLNLAREVCANCMDMDEKKWGLSSDTTMIAAWNKLISVLPYCAAYASFYKQGKRHDLVTKDGLNKFLLISRAYSLFGLKFVSPRQTGSVKYLFTKERLQNVSNDFTMHNELEVDIGLYTKEEVKIALKACNKEKLLKGDHDI